MRILLAAAIVIAVIVPAEAAAPPKLPGTAKKLSGTEITALYDGATLKFYNYAMGASGTVTYDLKQGTLNGTWSLGIRRGKLTGKVNVKGDTFCHPNIQKEQVCDSVYVDGKTIYQVSATGVVQSKNEKQ